MAEKIDGLKAIMPKIEKGESFGSALDRLLKSNKQVGAINKEIAQRIGDASNLRVIAEQAFKGLLEKKESPEKAFLEVLRMVYGEHLYPKDLKEAGMGMFDAIVMAHGGSKTLERVLADVGQVIQLEAGEKAKARIEKLTADKAEAESNLKDLEDANKSSEDKLKPFDELLDKGVDVFGHDGDLDKELKNKALQKAFFEVFAANEKLAEAITNNAELRDQSSYLETLSRGLIELLDDNGDENKLKQEWVAVIGMLNGLERILVKIKNVSPNYNALVEELSHANKKILEFNPNRHFGSDKHDAVLVPPNLDVLKGVIAFPEFAGKSRDEVFDSFQKMFAPIADWLSPNVSEKTPLLGEWLEEYKGLNSKRSSSSSHNPGRPQIESFLRKYFDFDLQSEVIGICNGFRGMRGDSTDVPSSAPAEPALRDFKEFLRNFEKLYDHDWERHDFGLEKADVNFGGDAEVSLVKNIGDYMDRFVAMTKTLFPTATSYQIDKSLSGLVPKIVNFRKLFELFEATFKFPPQHALSPTLQELEAWLEKNYYPLEKELKASRERRKETYDKGKKALEEKLQGIDEELKKFEPVLVTELKERLPEGVEATPNQLMAALLREAGLMAEIKDETLLICGQEINNLLLPKVRGRVVEALKMANKRLAGINQAALKDFALQIQNIEITEIEELVKDVNEKVEGQAEEDKIYKLNRKSAIADQIVTVRSYIDTLPAPVNPASLAGNRGLQGTDSDTKMANYRKELIEFGRKQTLLKTAFEKLTRLQNSIGQMYINAKTIFDGLERAQEAGAAMDFFPKDYNKEDTGLKAQFEKLSRKEGNFNMQDLDDFKNLAKDLLEYLASKNMDRLADSLADSAEAIENFGKNPDMLAQMIQEAALKLQDPNLKAVDAKEGAKKILEVDRWINSQELSAEERAAYLNAKKFDVMSSQGFNEWYKEVKFKHGEKEKLLSEFVGDVADFNDLQRLKKVLVKFKDHEVAAIYKALEKAHGGEMNEQMKVCFDALIERALNNPAARRAGKKFNFSDQRKLDCAIKYAKALIDDHVGESETSGFFERMEARKKEKAMNNKERFEIEMKLLYFKMMEEQIPKRDFEQRKRQLAKKYEQSDAKMKFLEYRLNTEKDRMKIAGKAMAAAAPEIIVRGTAGLAARILGGAWNLTMGKLTKGKLNVDSKKIGNFIGGNAKEIYGRDKEIFKAHTSHVVEIEILTERKAELDEEEAKMKRAMVVADGGIKVEDFFVSEAANDDVEEPPVAAAA